MANRIGELQKGVNFMIEGYAEYKRREYCKDVKCPIQLKLESRKEGSEEYEKTRKRCKHACIHTTYEFHHWLIEKGYLIVKGG
ncbi:hypothetical protein AUJ66_05835 [Candidatus Desantisbacteria bacterium CG1_02_38_46]|uniref:Uncharacterized protein n=3 Tax=unclassified Candidatus Desantisiibacteriota TaxID=3106372 RepID=A0A2H9PAP8_9BACT|nr:MAG: hypothetical protein AUJ66_05835 [Candidatus Desantisbacteria bacterium CG1_02_38_46]PIU52053.1 MAG: hypothetical protein COS91_01280 [Candidatus Desantisbacteria bacterium CG07_land_8_20_14_0_80_39_15]PIZ15567.1 MAG: hypothetical protein COY51_04885 [Candidatus Desantisbacteria bacterium CG_4_10_14_0_8_um_filter_39_17]